MFELGDLPLSRGGTLPDARLAYRTYGELAPDRSNAILFPTGFAGTHEANEWLIGDGRPLDTRRHFVIAPNLFGNGLIHSPSNTPPPYHRARLPHVTMHHNVAAQQRRVTERFGDDRLVLALPASVGTPQ